MHLGRDRVIGAWERRRRARRSRARRARSRRVLAELSAAEPRALLLTHIHLDHAGATGTLVAPLPGPARLRPRGRRPAPRRPLAAAAERRDGSTASDMERLWGEVLPVPERESSRCAAARSSRASRCSRTPGPRLPSRRLPRSRRAATLTSATWPGSGSRPATLIWLPTPPPDIDLELWRGLDRARCSSAGRERLLLTHYGSVAEPERHLAAARGRPRAPRRGAPATAIASASWPSSRRGSAPSRPSWRSEPARRCRRSRSGSGLERYWRH